MEMTLNRKGRSPFQRMAPRTCGLSSSTSCKNYNNKNIEGEEFKLLNK